MTQHDSGFRSARRVRSAMANAAAYRSVSQIAGAATYVMLVRIMSEYDYGIYNLLYSVPAVMGALLSLGIGNALLRFLPEYFSEGRFGLARHFVSWALRLRLLSVALFLSLCLLFWDRLAPIFSLEEHRDSFLLFIAIILTHFQCRILTIALSANLMQKWSSGFSALFAVLKLIGYFAAVYFGVSLQVILIIDLTSYVVWYAALRIAYHTRVPKPEMPGRVSFPRDERKRVTRYAAYYNFNDVGVVALKPTSDRLFIAAFLSPVAVGAYAFCSGLNAMIQKLTPVSFFNGVIEPLVFTLDAEKQSARARGYFKFLVKINYLAQFPIFVLVAAVPTSIIEVVFGGKFIEYQLLLVVVFAFPVLYCFQVPVTIMAQLRERAGIILASKIFAAYNVVAALLLIPAFGVYGAAIATGTAQLFKTVFVWYFVRDVASFRRTGRFFLTQCLLWAACWAAITFVTDDWPHFWRLGAALIIVGACALAGLRLAFFDKIETDLIRKVAGNRVSTLLETCRVISR